MLEDMEKVYEAFEESKSRAKMIDRVTQTDLRTFWLLRKRKPKNPKTIHLYFMIEDDVVYAMVDKETAKRGKVFTKKKIRGINWVEDEGGACFKFFKSKGAAVSFVKQLMKDYNIGNIADFKPELKSLTIRKAK